MGRIDVLDHHEHLFLRDEASEVVEGALVAGGLDQGIAAIPDHVLSQGEKFVHQGGLARQLHLNVAFAETRRLLVLMQMIEALHDSGGILHGQELDVCIVRLGRGTVHDDVNRLIHIIQKFGVLSKESDDLAALRVERDLCYTLAKVTTPGLSVSSAYVLDSDDPIVWTLGTRVQGLEWEVVRIQSHLDRRVSGSPDCEILQLLRALAKSRVLSRSGGKGRQIQDMDLALEADNLRIGGWRKYHGLLDDETLRVSLLGKGGGRVQYESMRVGRR